MNTFARRHSRGSGSAKRAAPGSGAYFKAFRVESRDYCSIGRIPSGCSGSAYGASEGDANGRFCRTARIPEESVDQRYRHHRRWSSPLRCINSDAKLHGVRLGRPRNAASRPEATPARRRAALYNRWKTAPGGQPSLRIRNSRLFSRRSSAARSSKRSSLYATRMRRSTSSKTRCSS